MIIEGDIYSTAGVDISDSLSGTRRAKQINL